MLTKQQMIKDVFECLNSRLHNGLIVVSGLLIGTIEINIIEEYALETMFQIIALSIIITFFCWHGNRLINAWHIEIMPWNINPPLKIFYLLLLNGIYTSVVIVSGILLFHYVVNLIPTAFLANALIWGVIVGMLVSLFMNTLFVGIYFFDQWKLSLVEAERLKRENIQSQLNSLRNQVNPHFLFNSLNTLTSLIAEDQDKAVNFVRDFSDLYRYILKSQEREISTLEDELHATNIYLKLQKERFEDKLQPQINISSNKMKTYLPTLTLQMLVENCIKHNIIGQSKPLHINIFTENGRLIVQNNLQKKNTAPFSTGLGLKNIKKRYDFLSNEGVEVIETEEHFKVVLPLLKMQQG